MTSVHACTLTSECPIADVPLIWRVCVRVFFVSHARVLQERAGVFGRHVWAGLVWQERSGLHRGGQKHSVSLKNMFGSVRTHWPPYRSQDHFSLLWLRERVCVCVCGCGVSLLSAELLVLTAVCNCLPFIVVLLTAKSDVCADDEW